MEGVLVSVRFDRPLSGTGLMRVADRLFQRLKYLECISINPTPH
jgi:hypothetical protein